MRKKIFKIILLAILILLFLEIKSNANITSTDSTVQSGQNVSITLKSSEKVYAYKIKLIDTGGLTFASATSSSGQANGTTTNGASSSGVNNLATYNFKTPTVNTTTKYTVKFSVSVSQDGDKFLDPITNTSTITVKAPEEVKSSSTTNNTNTNSNTNINNNTGNNSSQSSYVAPVQTKSSDATLKSVKVGGKTYSNPGSTITASNVLANISSITISAETNNSKAKVTGTGTKDLVTGTNIFQLTVTAEDGSKKTYKVRVTKLAEENQTPNVIESSNSNDLKLTSLEVEGINIFPGFKDDVYEYTANFHDLDTLNITAVANNKNAKIEILGNENLVDGDNVINIVVTLNDKTVTYKITANKAASLINVEESSQEVIEEKSEINNNSNKSNKKINIGFIGSVKDWWNNGGSLLALFWILWIALGIASIYALLAYKYSKILKEEYGYSFAKEGNNYSLDIEEDKEIGNQELEDWYTNPDNQIETISKSGGKHF